MGLVPFADFLFFIPQEELACTYGTLLYRSWTYAHRFHTKSAEQEKQYLFIPDKSYSPFILPQTLADLLSAQQLEYKLRSRCLPYRARGVKSRWQLTSVGTTTTRRDPDKFTRLPSPSTNLSFHLFCTQGGMCATMLWCSVTVPRLVR